ncbi:MAG: alcohol dehydrogenase [Subtercola sp.]|nr:alcohol dehydrogenase [Subtercola sp.]
MPNTWWPDTAAYSEFLSPTLIASGSGSAAQTADILVRQFGVASGTVLVAVDDIVLSNGLAQPVIDSLSGQGFDVVLSSGFGSEPSSEVVDAAAEKARAAGAVAIIGIGGGSVLDSAKLLSLLVRNTGTTADWLGAVDPQNSVAPTLLIPTTCGTGSEATRIAMVTVDGAKRASSSARYVPAAVILDPVMVASLPGFVVASTAMDALAHAVESLMSTAHSPMSAHHALTAIDLLVTNIAAASEGDQNALAQCLWGAHLAGQALNAGVVVGHSLAYCLAYEHPMAHGTSCALALPYCIAYNQNLDPALAAVLASALTSGASSDLSEAAASIMALARRLGLPTTLEEVQIPSSSEKAIASRIVTEYPRPTNPEPLDVDKLERLLHAMHEGDLAAAFAVTAGEVVR